jgi:hypothetical protein
MAEVITGEFSKYRSNLLDIHQSLKVAIWDVGPEKPVRPAKPVVSKEARPGTVEYDIEQIELRSTVENYEKLLASYLAQLKDYEQWHQAHSGPVTFVQWSCDWVDTQRHDSRAVAEGRQRARRYHRFDPRAPRQGLPVGAEPGASHREQVIRREEAEQAAEAARRNDPFFGDA